MLKGSGETVWDIREKIGVVSSELQVRYRKGIQVRDVVASGLFDSIGLFRRLSPEDRRMVEDWMDLLGILPMAERVFEGLSYGERRMALIARAMVKSPLLLILDEPCQGLDPANRRKMLKLIDRIGAGTGTRIIYVSHYEDEMPSCINRILRLERSGPEAERTVLIEDRKVWRCVGCGFCCVQQRCTFGVARHPEAQTGLCPELEWTGHRYVCRLMIQPGQMADFVKQELRSGEGCVSFNNPWRKDVRERTPEEAKAAGTKK